MRETLASLGFHLRSWENVAFGYPTRLYFRGALAASYGQCGESEWA